MIPSPRISARGLKIRTQLFIATGLTALLALAVLAMYWPGLSGGFLLDDTPNLGVIAQLPANPGLSDILNLATTGFAGIFGRSISIFSFLLQYESWPDPRNFKLINLLIHLVNGCLVALCCALIASQWRKQSVSAYALAAIAFVWLAHPIQVSTVLYVVQRMTLLSASFTLLSLIFYLLGKQCLLASRNVRGAVLMSLGLGLFAALSVLSKENGVLVYLYVLVLEYTLFASGESPLCLQRFRRGLLSAVLLLAVVGLIFVMPSTLEGYALKPFSFSERLLTQFPVLATYIASIALLLPNYYGVFHDDFATAQGLTLVLSLIFVLGLIALALLRRRQWPLFAFAVLWFFAGHALESTFLPLEYYFEHRNYLPLMGPLFALVVFATDTASRLAETPRNGVIAAAALVLAFLLVTTVRQTTLWGSSLDQAYAAVEQHPESTRAQSNLVEKLSAAGQLQPAFDYHLSVIDSAGPAIPPYIRWLEFTCILPTVEPPQDAVLRSQASGAPHDYGAIFSLNNLVFGILEGRCPNAPVEKVQLVLEGLAENANFAVSRPDIVFHQALLQAAAQNFMAAAELASDSFATRPDPRVGLYQVNWQIRAGRVELAESTLQDLVNDHDAEIAASADLTARLQFLRDRLQALSN